ncbi:MAG: (2Fe-2S) ferredoxin domain-containing protein [Elusimicrobia bacterium]|nr:(2Fe-2S) ferredoxin domain-containing protein [Elusimicrobiota bacterium]
MKTDEIPFRKTVFVCTNVRDGSRVACGDPERGGLAVCEALKLGVKRLGLKDTVRVARSGCLDLCEQGPNVFLYPGDVWLSEAAPADADEILKKLAE